MTWEYVAGFFDGEGALTQNDKGGFRISIAQTNRPVLENIKGFSGVGNICLVTKRKEHWKESWVYYVSKQKDVYIFLTKTRPFLIVKKKLVLKRLPTLREIIKLQNRRKLRLTNRKQRALSLRGSGLSYWRIGKRMGLDRSYVRRLMLGFPKPSNKNGGRSSIG